MRCLVGLVAALALAGCGGSDSKPLLAGGKAAAVRGGLTPDVHLFGEPVVAHVDVIVDREQIDPDAVRVTTDFKPYESVGETTVEQEEIGQFTHLRYTTTLRCLREDCIPRTLTGDVTISQTPELPLFPENQQRDEKRKYEFPAALVTAEGEPKDRALGRVVWPPLRSVSRINWYDSSVVGQGFPFIVDGDARSGAELPHLADRAGNRAPRARGRASRVPGDVPHQALSGASRTGQERRSRRCRRSSAHSRWSSGRAGVPRSTRGARHSRRWPTSSTRTRMRPQAERARRAGLRPRRRPRR